MLSGATDARADLFSLGALVWQALTGRSAFAADTEAHTIMRLTSETPHVPSSFHKFVPEALDALVMRLLHRLPGHRFASASEVIAALERIAPQNDDAVAAEEQLARRVAKLLGEHAPESLQRKHATTRPSAKTRVLVAHGSRTVRAHAAASLGQRFAVADASTADGARALMAVDLPDVVLCDAALLGTFPASSSPERPGLALCRWMRAAPKLAAIPFVLLADEVTAELCSEAMKAGAQAVLPKSFDGDHLVATVDRLIEEAKR